eukprot:CAMPEP_0119128484 /NCGR_PEP_ID=MMETSP1310-20130426/6620_1 /TAXON_ID=464262 /ORGANISM="Genus nov. species nov., Strain RCC2339" /LENGTH=473 /DNA_ID=CAMNT_0007118829 /DNA_START=87 /DNA_END=1508 /DNA_ORIENTATION=-
MEGQTRDTEREGGRSTEGFRELDDLDRTLQFECNHEPGCFACDFSRSTDFLEGRTFAQTFPVAPLTVFQEVFSSDKKYYETYHSDLPEYEDVVVKPWMQSEGKCCITRQVEFIVHVNLPCGGDTSKVVQEQRCFMTPTGFVLSTRTSALDVPYGSCFYSDSVWKVEEVANDMHKSDVELTMFLTWRASTIMKSFVAKLALAGVIDYHSQLLSHLKGHLLPPMLQPAVPSQPSSSDIGTGGQEIEDTGDSDGEGVGGIAAAEGESAKVGTSDGEVAARGEAETETEAPAPPPTLEGLPGRRPRRGSSFRRKGKPPRKPLPPVPQKDGTATVGGSPHTQTPFGSLIRKKFRGIAVDMSMWFLCRAPLYILVFIASILVFSRASYIFERTELMEGLQKQHHDVREHVQFLLWYLVDSGLVDADIIEKEWKQWQQETGLLARSRALSARLGVLEARRDEMVQQLDSLVQQRDAVASK